ncbi:MltG/YceG/YrrL family protein [Rummeliibacillus pycnus]|uniref:endolytic transglycosylase MltG n=1 Tax=Rummeliibacillus pycnus TaxID=101070 RepID=UPI000C9BD3AC|nr:endolytic transglycosylase MltG [Rummeliibacillus pycnus]
MMKSIFRSIGIGMFLAGTILAVNNYFNPDTSAKTITTFKSTSSSQKDTVIIKKKELTALKAEAADAKAQLAKIQTDYNQLKNDSSAKKDPVKSYTLAIKRGMGTAEVSKALKDGGIVQNDAEFERYIINKDQAKNIQIGDYKLTSDMTNAEILKVITTAK